MMTAAELIAFEQDIAECFNRGEIRAPIHLDGGNEEHLIKIFKDFKEGDWVCCSWRSHAKALLANIPPEKIKAEIMAGRSICLCFPEHRFISSAIVGGILPIALGIAWSIKRNGGKEKVYCFLGDMTAMGGMFRECLMYAGGHSLPIQYIVEDNDLSVCTSTADAWGRDSLAGKGPVIFQYKLGWPHSGAGKRISF